MDPKVDGSNPVRAVDTYASEIERALGKRRRGRRRRVRRPVELRRRRRLGIKNLKPKRDGARGCGDVFARKFGDDDVKDELAKEWAALTTWIRMNLHQPRTNKRKVLFVGHHPRLHPVPGAEAAIGETRDSERWRGRLGPTGEVIGGGGGGGGGVRGGGKRAKVSGDAHGGGGTRKGRIDGEDFVFVLNPEIDWSDVNIDTRVRMRTLVAETMDIFRRKYAKRKTHEWERKVQKYKPPGSKDGRTPQRAARKRRPGHPGDVLPTRAGGEARGARARRGGGTAGGGGDGNEAAQGGDARRPLRPLRSRHPSDAVDAARNVPPSVANREPRPGVIGRPRGERPRPSSGEPCLDGKKTTLTERASPVPH